MDASKKYRSISLPSELIDKIEQIICEHPELGYSSVSEFVKEALRTKISEIVVKKEVILNAQQR